MAARQLNSSQLILQATVAAEGSARSIRAMVLVLAKSARQMMSFTEETTPWWHLPDVYTYADHGVARQRSDKVKSQKELIDEDT